MGVLFFETLWICPVKKNLGQHRYCSVPMAWFAAISYFLVD